MNAITNPEGDSSPSASSPVPVAESAAPAPSIQGDTASPPGLSPSVEPASAVSPAAAASIPIADLMRLLRDPPEAVMIAGCKALNSVPRADIMAATLGGRHDLARLKMRARWDAMVASIEAHVRALAKVAA